MMPCRHRCSRRWRSDSVGECRRRPLGMMGSKGPGPVRETRRRRCLCCQKLFRCDPRTRTQQKYCSEVACRAASKQASQLRWLRKPENQEYFCGPQHVSRVQAWRATHPGYGQGSQITGPVLQETRLTQPTDKAKKTSHLTLQETRQRQGIDGIGASCAAQGVALQDLM